MRWLSILIVLFLTADAAAQDTHYWTNQFGTRSTLLSGSVVAGYKDNSMIYYNPGALGLLDSGSVSINANLYEIDFVTLKNKTGQELNLNGSSFKSIPITIFGLIRNRDPRWKFGYGILTPTEYRFRTAARLDTLLNVIDDEESPGLEEYVAQFFLNDYLNETMVTGGVGYKLTKHSSVGASLQFIARTLRYDKTLSARALYNIDTASFDIATLDVDERINYFQVRARLKLGYSHQTEKQAIGFTFTTPSVSLFSNGDLYSDLTGTNVLSEQYGRINITANGGDDKLRAKYRSPWSLAAGYSRFLPGSSINFSVEYFHGIDVYPVMDGNSGNFVRPSVFGDLFQMNEFLTLNAAAKPVFNFAIGYERDISDLFSLICGFRSNFSYFDNSILEQPGLNPVVTSWNIYHLNIGGHFSNDRNDIMFGIQMGYGRKDLSDDIDVFSPEDDFLLLGGFDDAIGKYFNIGAILGWNYIFRAKPAKPVTDEATY